MPGQVEHGIATQQAGTRLVEQAAGVRDGHDLHPHRVDASVEFDKELHDEGHSAHEHRQQP